MLTASDRKSPTLLAHEHDNLPAMPGDFRIWHNPQRGNGNVFYHRVSSLEAAETLLDALTAYDLYKVASLEADKTLHDALAAYDIFQSLNKIKGDYSIAQGIEVYEEDGKGGFAWIDWFEPEAGDTFYSWPQALDEKQAA